METLFKAINDFLKDKDTTLSLLKWELECLKEENEGLKSEIEKYAESEGVEYE